MKSSKSSFQLAVALIIAFLQTVSATVLASPLSQEPLFLGTTAPPNVLIILDNSQSTDQEIMTKPHWERAAYEYSYANGKCDLPPGSCTYGLTPADISGGQEVQGSCIGANDDCGILRDKGDITLSGPDLANAAGCTSTRCSLAAAGNGARNFLSYNYLSSSNASENITCDPTEQVCDDNLISTNCKKSISGYFSLAPCPRIEALDWRVRSADLNVIYYNPSLTYNPWKLPEPGNTTETLGNANFTAVRGNPYSNEKGYNKIVNLNSQAPLGVDPGSCNASGTSCSTKGFVYYVWIDDKGFGSPPATCPETARIDNSQPRPHRGPLCINMTDGPNNVVDLWDSRYKMIVGDSITVQKISCSKAYDGNGSLQCSPTQQWTNLAALSDLPPADFENIVKGRELTNGKLTLADEKQNIANWFQYYRRRILTEKALISEIPYIAPNYRYSLMSQFDPSDQKLVITSDNNLTDLLANFKQSNPNQTHMGLIYEFPPQSTTDFQDHNQNVLDALYRLYYYQSTPTRAVLHQAGKYYMNKVSGTTIDPVINQCQRNYSLIITDGYYTKFDTNTVSSIGDADGDGASVTLADVARYYYVNDLRSDFPDVLNPTVCDDPNNYPKKQHMVTFGISLGVDGTLTDSNGDGWPDNIVNPQILCPPPAGYTNVWNQASNSSWGSPLASCDNCSDPKRIDDLWHAAYNSHGAYIFAQDPEKLRSALRTVLEQFSVARSFSASASSSSFYKSGSSLAFQTSFEGQYWTGDLKAYTIDANGNRSKNPQWSAAEKLNNIPAANRTILSYNSGPILFSGDLTSLGLNQAQVEFLRGKGAGTGVNKDDLFIRNNNFRIRSSVLGDIIQSDPVYVAQPSFRYDEYNCTECNAYATFKSNKASRKKMVYVGANDGMLHGFDAASGDEKIAYIPGILIDKLSLLTSRSYTHRYFVEGSPTVGDAYFNSNWRTVLVGSLRAGGQAIFALDVTNPDSFGTTGTASVLWEFSDNNDADMGYSFSKPVIVRLNDNNHTWAAIFGNGYHNTEQDGNNPADASHAANTLRNGNPVVGSGKAVLYVVNLENGALIKAIRTDEGTLTNPNGLSTPAVIDTDDNLTADYVYAGDLYGNLWKFDIRNSDLDQWQAIKLFNGTVTTVDANNVQHVNPQPITVRPVVDAHPLGKNWGYMIYFGTGKYFEQGDNEYSSTTQQSFYGIWDRNEMNQTSSANPKSLKSVTTFFTRDRLFAQQLGISNDYRTVTPKIANSTINWLKPDGSQDKKGWLIDLDRGEKQVTNPALFNKKVIFTTLVLPETPLQRCDSDGSSSWLMVVNSADGGTPDEITFDLTGDFKFNKDDLNKMGSKNIAGQSTQSNNNSNNPNNTNDTNDDNNNDGGVGALPKPALISGDCGDPLIALARGTEGGSVKYIINPGSTDCGRQSWRQLWR